MLRPTASAAAFLLLGLTVAACGSGGGNSDDFGNGSDGGDGGALTDGTQPDVGGRTDSGNADGTTSGHDGSVDSGGGSSDSGVTGHDSGLDATLDAPEDAAPDSGGALDSGEAGPTCPSTCAQLGANCGTVSDTNCGGVIQCGGCPSGETCGGAGMHNVCGMAVEACSPQSCAQQHINCGSAGDGCGGTLQCGTCTSPQTCGGGNTPGQCGCTGLCAQVPICTPPATTTITGTVLDPAGIHPLYNALVYVPNNPSDPGLQPFPPGITCDVCGTTAAGDPLVTTYTAVNGTFTLSGVPVGPAIPLVVQLGHWRRQITVNVSNSCGPNAVPAGTLTMPKNHGQGDIPRIAILTGGFDPMECVLRKMGVQDTEFTDPGGTGHIQFYKAAQPNEPPNPFGPYAGICPPNPYGYGAQISAATPTQTTLFGSSGGTPTIDQYDLSILACEGYEENMQAYWPNLGAYTSAGGRVFMTDYSYDWMAKSNGANGGTNVTENPAYSGVATWDTDQNPQGSPETGIIDLVNNPKGMAFEQWLQIIGITAGNTVSLNPVFHNSDAVTSPTQRWLYWGTATPIHFTFNTPVGGTPTTQCGRAVYSDWHADVLGFANTASYPACPYLLPTTAPYYSHGLTFPSECDSNPMTAQEAILEFMLFDLSACVQPYTPICTPQTCTSENIQCGPAGDGCGNLLQCGSCPMGQTCGGNGPGHCGTQTNCVPETCASQGIQCGPAGDGCGNQLNCGNCQTGQVCGGSQPGKCANL